VEKIDWASLSRFASKTVLFTLIAEAAIIVVIIAVLESVIYEFELPQIPEVHFPKNQWIDIANVTLTGKTEKNYAILYDELTYNLQISNKQNFTLSIIPEILDYSGDMPTHVKFNEFELKSNDHTRYEYNFTTMHEGTNHLQIIFNVFNKTNNVFTEHANNDIQVISYVAKLQHDTNSISLKAVIISGAIGIITTSVIIASLIISNKQNSLTKMQVQAALNEQSSRLRPWVAPVGITATYIEFQNSVNGTVLYDAGIDLIVKGTESESNAIISFAINVKNVGTMPGLEVKYRYMEQRDSFNRDHLFSSDIVRTISLMPEEKDDYVVEIPMIETDIGCYVGLGVEYLVGKSMMKAGKIWNLTSNDEILTDSWILENSSTALRMHKSIWYNLKQKLRSKHSKHMKKSYFYNTPVLVKSSD